MKDIIVATFYHFTRFENPAALRETLLDQLPKLDLKGTILLATEGINGTLSGSRIGIDTALKILRALPNCMLLEHKESYAEKLPFYRLKVRLKKEIVTMKVPNVSPLESVGNYVEAKYWNDFISNPKTVVIDTRNNFEVEIGTFQNAINPGTIRFSDLPKWLEKNRAELKNKRIAMFCTGGIRCEKATSYLKQRGMNDVFHLKGGILQYLEEIQEDESLWHGECFVFDHRVSVKHGLKIGDYELCHACRTPVSSIARSSSNFVLGVSCDRCINQRTDKQRARYAARQAQIELAEDFGVSHLGVNYGASTESSFFAKLK